MESQRNDVLFIVNALGGGGAEAQLLQFLRRRPHHLRLAVVPFESADAMTRREFESLGVQVHPVERQGRSFSTFIFELGITLHRIKPQIVHTILAGSSGTWGRLVSFLSGVPIVLHSERSLAPEVTATQRRLQPVLDSLTERILVNADAIAHRLVDEGVPAGKVRLLRNGLDLERFQPRSGAQERALLGIPTQAVVAGFLGRFRSVKRVDLLLAAFQRMLPELRPDWLLLGGEGPEESRLRELVAEDPWLSKHTRFLGRIHETPAFLSSLDYLVLSSDTEGTPNVVLEAMAMERVVVSTSVSDVPRLIDGTGFLARPGDAQSLADALNACARLPTDKRHELGRRARTRVAAEFDLKASASAFWDTHLEYLPHRL